MARAYLPILLLIGFVVFMAAVILGISSFTASARSARP
jgi:hypothetical protein